MIQIFFSYSFEFFSFTFICVCVHARACVRAHAHTRPILQHTCRGQKTPFRSQLSPSTICIPGTELRTGQGPEQAPLPTGPSHWLVLQSLDGSFFLPGDTVWLYISPLSSTEGGRTFKRQCLVEVDDVGPTPSLFLFASHPPFEDQLYPTLCSPP